MIRILGTVLATLLGLAFGSFLNVCLSRWPEGESIVHPRSHCRKCGHTLAAWENLPLVSWFALRGRCLSCGTRIGWRYLIVEATVGGLWAIVAWNSIGDIPPFRPIDIYRLEDGAAMAAFLWLLICLAVLDAENLWLPNFLTLPGTAIGFGLTLYFMVRGNSYYGYPLSARLVLYRLGGIAAAAALILLIRWIYWLVRHREGIGLGDAKLMALLAAWLGFQATILALGVGVVIGALVALVVLLIPNREPGQRWGLLKLPLGTFLCIGGIVSALWGHEIIAAYRRWAGF